MPTTRRGATLDEGLVVLAIIATLIGLLAQAFFAASGKRAENGLPDAAASPPETSLLNTVRHDGHLWVMGRSFEGGYHATHFVHHPDCPCKGRQAESGE